jgi:hypothetical protein
MYKPTEQQVHNATERILQVRAIVTAIRNGALARHKSPGVGMTLEELANLAWAAEYLLDRAYFDLEVRADSPRIAARS